MKPIHWILLLLILAVGAGLRLASFHGYGGSDDGAYALLSWQMAEGEFSIGQKFYSDTVGPDGSPNDVPVFPVRLGLLAPVSLLFKLFGPTETALILYPFVLSLLGVLLAFAAGRFLFSSDAAGLLAAGITAILPTDIHQATKLLPDLPASFWANFGIFLLFLAFRESGFRRRVLWSGLSGLSLFLSWMTKESLFYYLPILGIVSLAEFLKDRRQWRVPVVLSSVVGIGILAECLVYYVMLGDALYRLHEVQRNYVVCSMWFWVEGGRFGYTAETYWSALADRLFFDGPKALFLTLNFAALPLVGVIALLWGPLRRSESARLLFYWFISLVLMFNFMSSNFQRYEPLILFERYMTPILFPAILLASGLIVSLVSRIRLDRTIRPKLAGGVGGLIGVWVLVSSVSGIEWNLQAGKDCKAERIMAARLSPDEALVTDRRTAQNLRFFWGYPKNPALIPFEKLDEDRIPEPSHILINRPRVEFLHEHYGYPKPGFYTKIPGDWAAVWGEFQAELYRTPDRDGLLPPR